MRRLIALLASATLLAACGAGTDGTASGGPASGSPGSHVTVPVAGGALLWGNGPYGLVLLHAPGADATAWNTLAVAFAADRMTVLAPEAASTDDLRAAITWLHGRDVPRVAVLAVGAAGSAVADLGATDPALIDQAIVVSPPAGLDWTAAFPKLFAASEGEAAAAAAREAAAQAGGTWNALDVVSGSASGSAIFTSAAGSDLMTAILRRLDERR
jgi:hypothetical protein